VWLWQSADDWITKKYPEIPHSNAEQSYGLVKSAFQRRQHCDFFRRLCVHYQLFASKCFPVEKYLINMLTKCCPICYRDKCKVNSFWSVDEMWPSFNQSGIGFKITWCYQTKWQPPWWSGPMQRWMIKSKFGKVVLANGMFCQKITRIRI
jgi:hypothetical protein